MKSIFNLNSKIIVVTGGSGLLGETFVKAICSENGIAVIAEKDLEVAEKTAEKIKSTQPNAQLFPVKIDITDSDNIKNAINHISDRYGKIDCLVNNAYPRNKNYGRKFYDVDYEDFCTNIGMNLGGYFLTSQIFSTYFSEQNYGNIINISSIYGVVAPKFEVYEKTSMTMPIEYAAIKSGLIHLTKYMAKYFKGKNIRVNAISPGGIFDNQDEKFITEYNKNCLTKGMLDRNDITGALLFLISENSQYINGQNIIIDDGFSL